ncbi:MAG: energy transducer TonB [Candidatus Acidiferrum sp.]
MLRILRPAFMFSLAFCCLGVSPSHAQAPVSAPPPSTPVNPLKLDFPDSTKGLENLAKEILKAQKNGDSARATALAQSMVLPDPAAWYLQTFGPPIASDEGAKYAADRTRLPAEILTVFWGALQNHNTEVTAARFGETCDDNAGESAFGTLQLRLQPVPLYELRFMNGGQFMRFFALAYVDGGFRFVLAPTIANHFPYRPSPARPSQAQSSSNPSAPAVTRVRQGGNVIAAKLLKKVQPVYPDIAREEHLQGTVRLHAIIGKDGSVTDLLVLSGYCSLAKSSMDAVSRWRYSPTLLLGRPVEIDTTINVIFSLNH